MGQMGLLVLGAILGAVLGHYVRRYEHVRAERLNAYSALVAAFVDAARTGADLLSVHVQTGYPHDLNKRTWSGDQIETMSRAHQQAWAAAGEARHRFEVAVSRAELVASRDTSQMVTDLRAFLDRALYSGLPWRHATSYPEARLDPVAIVPAAIEFVRPHVHRTARRLWGYAAPKAPKLVDGSTNPAESDDR